MQFDISPLREAQFDAALDFVCNVFVHGSVLHRALGVTAQEYRPWIESSFARMANEELTFVATCRDTAGLVGCIAGGDYAPELARSPAGDADEMDLRMRPMTALLSALRDQYRQHRDIGAGECVLVDMAMVSEAHRRHGIYRRLRERLHQEARTRGFARVAGELSAASTQRLCIEGFEHAVLGRVAYADFVVDGERPFAAITCPEAILLVEGAL